MSSAVNVGPLRAFGFPPQSVKDADLERWVSERFVHADGLPAVLEQRLGGPCGVLAVLQARVLAVLLFSGNAADPQVKFNAVDPDNANNALAEAISATIWQARRQGVDEAFVCSGSVRDDNVHAKKCTSLASLVR